nr:serine protease [Streptomyces sp. PKU-EA00015]
MRADTYDVLVVNAAAVGSPLVALATEMYEAFVVGRPQEPARARSAGEVQEWLTELGLVDTLHRVRGKAGGKLLVVLDQAEALLARDAAEVAQVAGLLFPESRPTGGLRVLLTLRADFMDAALRHPHLGPALRRGVTLPLTPMTRDQLREVIIKPLEQVPGVDYERGLVERILDDADSGPGTLPLLGFVLKKLWEKRERGLLRLAAYEEAGGVPGALARHAEQVWESCVEEHDEAGARRLLTGLVRVLPGSPAPLRRRLTRQEAGEERWRVAQWLAASERRLLVTHGGPGEPETVELAHEALVAVWPALQEQVRADSEFLAGRAELSHERERWTKGNRAPGLLPGALQLAAVEGRLAGREEELDDEDRDFIRIARQHRRARRNRMRAAWTAVAVVLALIAALGTFLVHQSRISAQREAEGRSRLLAGFSAEVAKQDPGQATLIAMAAYRIAPTDEARNAMLRRYDQFKDAAWVLSGTEGQIEDAVTSVDGTVTLVTSGNGRATLFVRRAGGGVLRHHLGLAEMAFHPLVSRDGRRIAYVTAAGALVWHDVDPEADTGQNVLGAPHPIRDPEFENKADVEARSEEDSVMAFSPDAGHVATVADDRLRLWDLETGDHREVPGRVPSYRVSVRFGPDEDTLVVLRPPPDAGGASLVTVDADTGKVRDLAVDDVDLTATLYGPALALSGDGTVLVACSKERQQGDLTDAVYRAVRVTDGRVLNSYTDKEESCKTIAADRAGERFAVGQFADWALVGTRRGSHVHHIRTPEVDNHTGRLLGDTAAPAVLAVPDGANTLMALPLRAGDVEGDDIVLNEPRLVDGGKTLVARVRPGDEPDGDEILALVDVASGRITSRVKRPRTPTVPAPHEANSLTVNDTGTLVADVVGRNRILVRKIPSLGKVAEITTLMPPVDEAGYAEPLSLSFHRGDELVTVSGSRVEHWNGQSGRRISRVIDARALKLGEKNPPPFASEEGAVHSGFAVNRRPEADHVQIMVTGDHTLHAVDRRTGKENKALRVSLGPDVERAFLDSSGRYAAAKTPGGMLELWSAKAGQRPRRTIGPLGPLGANDLFTGDGFTFDFTGRDGEFYLANGSSVRFQQASDPSHFESYDFETNQYFIAAAKDGRTLLRTLSASGFRTNGGSGRLDLIRLDPELWGRHLCRAIGRDLGEDERRGMPAGLPDRICPA